MEAIPKVNEGSFTFVDDSKAAPKLDFLALLPEQYRTTELAVNISKAENPVVALYDKHVSLEKMMGSRPGIPGADATPEQIATYHKAIGVPDDVSGYVYEPITATEEVDKPVVDYLNSSREGPIMDYMKQTAKQHGLTPTQFKAMVGGYEAALIANNREGIIEAANAVQAKTQTMVELGNQSFGEQKFAGMLDVANSLIDECAGPVALPILRRLPAEAHAGIAMLLHGIKAKYISEDKFRGTGAPSYSGGMTHEELRGARRSLMAQKAYQDFSHPDHMSVNNRVKELDAREKAMYESQSR